VEDAAMMPSWARVIERAMARPRPVPPLWSMRVPESPLDRRLGSAGLAVLAVALLAASLAALAVRRPHTPGRR
jgi:hypothetical protein